MLEVSFWVDCTVGDLVRWSRWQAGGAETFWYSRIAGCAMRSACLCRKVQTAPRIVVCQAMAGTDTQHMRLGHCMAE